MSPKRSISELITAAQNDGWHQDPLGREIIGELAERQRLAERPKQVILALGAGLVLALALGGWMLAKNAQLTEKAASETRASALAEATAKGSIEAARGEAEAQRARAEAAEQQVKTITAALNGQQAAMVDKFNEQISRLREENDRLRLEIAALKAAEKARPAP